MRTELTNTPLGHVLEVTPTRIVFEVEGDASKGFKAGDEVMLMKVLQAPVEPTIPDGWMTLQDYAIREGISVGAANSRISRGAVASREIDDSSTPTGKRTLVSSGPPLRRLCKGAAPEVKSLAVKLYVAGASSEEVSKVVGFSSPAILRWIREAGHQVRGPFYDPTAAP